MKTTHVKTNSLKKALSGSRPFDEADYYLSKQVEMGGDKDDREDEDEEEEVSEEED